jgi:hypothetical protein
MTRIRFSLTETIKTVPDALKFMGLTSIPDPTELKTTYRNLSKKFHPDAGGSDQQMKDLNDANDVLSKVKGSSNAVDDWKARQAAQEEQNSKDFDRIEKFFKELFDENVFLDFMKKFIKDPLTVSVKYPKKDGSILHSAYGIWYQPSVEAFNADRTTVIYLKYAIKVKNMAQGALGSSTIDEKDLVYDVSTVADVYHNKRKEKVGQRDWYHGIGTKAIEDFSQIFPVKKMTQIFADNRVQKVFKKADMLLGLEREAGARVQEYPKGTAITFRLFPEIPKPPYSNGTCISLDRSVVNRYPIYSWGTAQSYIPDGTGKRLTGTAFMGVKLKWLTESVESMDRIVEAVKEIRNKVKGLDEKTDGPKIMNIVKDILVSKFPG